MTLPALEARRAPQQDRLGFLGRCRGGGVGLNRGDDLFGLRDRLRGGLFRHRAGGLGHLKQ